MKKILFSLFVILLATRCASTSDVTEQSSSIARVNFTELDEGLFYIKKEYYETISSCLASGLYKEDIKVALDRKVIKYPNLRPIYEDLEEGFEVRFTTGIKPTGEVVMVRVEEISARESKAIARKMASILFDYRYEEDLGAPCLIFRSSQIDFALDTQIQLR